MCIVMLTNYMHACSYCCDHCKVDHAPVCEVQFAKPSHKRGTAEQTTQAVNHAEVLTDEVESFCTGK